MYRYRTTNDYTSTSEKAIKHLPKLGFITEIRGYRYIDKHRVAEEAVLVKGENGTARFSGLTWGYGGTGPHGLIKLLIAVGLSEQDARSISLLPRSSKIGTDWKLTRDINYGWTTPTCEVIPNPS